LPLQNQQARQQLYLIVTHLEILTFRVVLFVAKAFLIGLVPFHAYKALKYINLINRKQNKKSIFSLYFFCYPSHLLFDFWQERPLNRLLIADVLFAISFFNNQL